MVGLPPWGWPPPPLSKPKPRHAATVGRVGRVESYAKHIRQTGAWTGIPELRCLANISCCRIRVIMLDERVEEDGPCHPVFSFNVESAASDTNTIWLGLTAHKFRNSATNGGWTTERVTWRRRASIHRTTGGVLRQGRPQQAHAHPQRTLLPNWRTLRRHRQEATRLVEVTPRGEVKMKPQRPRSRLGGQQRKYSCLLVAPAPSAPHG